MPRRLQHFTMLERAFDKIDEADRALIERMARKPHDYDADPFDPAIEPEAELDDGS